VAAALDLLGDVAPRRYVHGEVIAHQGEPVTALSLVTAGVVRLSAVTSNGREVVVGLVGAGQLFGESSLLGVDEPSPVEARAVGTAVVVELPGSTLSAMFERSPAMAGQIARFIAARLHRTSEALQDALTQDVTSRISLRLRELARDHGRPGPGGVHIRIPLTQEELARMVGASREAVNRALAKLAQGGLVRTENRWVIVPDPERLERVADGAGHGPRRPTVVSRIPEAG
jgi:CRP/FNR family transcriptional regulator, cyclic AMP receptor protein